MTKQNYPTISRDNLNEIFPGLNQRYLGIDKVWNSLFDGSEWYYSSTAYPPYNIIQDGENFTLEFAMAGFSKEEIEVELEQHPRKILKIRTKDLTNETDGDTVDKDSEKKEIFVHRGIAKRKFEQKFLLRDDAEVDEVKMKDGVLTIKLVSVIKEEHKPKLLEISG